MFLPIVFIRYSGEIYGKIVHIQKFDIIPIHFLYIRTPKNIILLKILTLLEIPPFRDIGPVLTIGPRHIDELTDKSALLLIPTST